MFRLSFSVYQGLHLAKAAICWILLWKRQWHPTPVLLPGKSHGQRTLVGCSPWGREELDTTKRLHFHFRTLEKEMAAHSSALAWRITGTGEPGGLPSMGLHRVRHNWSDLAAAAAGSYCFCFSNRIMSRLPYCFLYLLRNYQVFHIQYPQLLSFKQNRVSSMREQLWSYG